jgi:hypothetical protein
MEYVWIPIILGTGFFAMIALIFYFTSKSKSDRARYQAEVQARLIEKFGSGPEFVTFLQSPQGRDFMGNIEEAPRWYAREQILSGLRKSVVISFLGLAFLILGMTRYGRHDGMLIPGVLLLCLGLGFFVSAIMSARLSKQWGLLDGDHRPAQPPVQS